MAERPAKGRTCAWVGDAGGSGLAARPWVTVKRRHGVILAAGFRMTGSEGAANGVSEALRDGSESARRASRWKLTPGVLLAP
jgi:hypothetical protein